MPLCVIGLILMWAFDSPLLKCLGILISLISIVVNVVDIKRKVSN